MGHFRITEILTEAEIQRAWQLYFDAKPGTFNRLVVAEIVGPNIDRVSKALGQEMDARFVGYAIEYVFNEATR